MTSKKVGIRFLGIFTALLLLVVRAPQSKAAPHLATATSTPISVYGAWHCSNDACLWENVCSGGEQQRVVLHRPLPQGAYSC